MGLLLKLLVALVAFSLIVLIVILLLNFFGIDVYRYSVNGSKDNAASKETSISYQTPVQATPRVPEATGSALQSTLAKAILDATENETPKTWINTPNLAEVAQSCASAIIADPVFQSFPGYQYSHFEANVFSNNTFYSQNPEYQNDYRLNLTARYAEEQHIDSELDFLRESLEKDHYAFRLIIDPPNCIISKPNDKPDVILRTLIPLEIQEQALTLAKKDPLVSKRLQERNYDNKINFWYTSEDLKLLSSDYFGTGVKDKFIVSESETLISVSFENKVDTCNSYSFTAYVNIETGFVYTSELNYGMMNCATFH